MTDAERQSILEGIEIRLKEEVAHLDRARASCDTHQLFLDTLKKILPGHPFDEFQELIVLNDFHAYTIFSLLDLYVTVKGMLTAKSDWERLFHFKHGYFVIFEALDTYYKHNTKLNELIQGHYISMKDSFLPVAKEIKEFAANYGYREKMADNRNTVLAHIKTSFQVYYDCLLKLTAQANIEMILSFMNILQHLRDFLGAFVSVANTQWKEDGVRIDNSIMEYINKIENLFAAEGTEPAEFIEIKKNLFNVLASIKNNLKK